MLSGYLAVLPVEAIWRVLTYMSSQDAARLCLVSRGVYQLALPRVWCQITSLCQLLVLGRPEYTDSPLKCSMDPHNKGIYRLVRGLEIQFSEVSLLDEADLQTLETFFYNLRRRSYTSLDLFPNLEQLTFGHIDNRNAHSIHQFPYDLHQVTLWNVITSNIPNDCQIIVSLTDMLPCYFPALHETHLLIDEHCHDARPNYTCCLIDWSPIASWTGIETLSILLDAMPAELWSAISGLPHLISLDISSMHNPDYIMFPFPALLELKAGPVFNKSFSHFIPPPVLRRLKSLDIFIHSDQTQECLVDPGQIRRLPNFTKQQIDYMCSTATELEALTLRGSQYDALEILPFISPILPQLRDSFRLIGFYDPASAVQAFSSMVPPEASVHIISVTTNV